MIHRQIADANSGRMSWMDALRGCAILLVIFDHGLGQAAKGGLAQPEWAVTLSMIFHPLRMPLMVFLSGMLLARSLDKGPRAFVRGKVHNILYPYFLWELIYFGLWFVASPVTTVEHELSDILNIFYSPPIHLWFLYYLFIYYLLAMALRAVPNLLLASVSLGISFVFDMQDMDQFQRFFFLFAFFLLGDLVARHADRMLRTLREPRVFALLVAGSVGLVVLALTGIPSRYQLTSLPFACAGIGLAIVIFYLWRSYRFIDRLAFVGRHSLQAYILHWLFLAAGYVAVAKLTPTATPTAMFLAVTTIGYVATFVSIVVIRRLQLQWLFSWPRQGLPTAVRASLTLRT